MTIALSICDAAQRLCGADAQQVLLKGTYMHTKHSLVLAALLAMTGLVGCEASPRGGGMADEESFTLLVPKALELRQGAIQTVDVSLVRGDLFKQDVQLTMKSSPGLNLDPSSATIRASERPHAQVKIAAGENIALGEYRVSVTAAPTNGQPTMAEFRVNVLPK
jgi:hypothetical protein